MTDLAARPVAEPGLDEELLAEAQRQIAGNSRNATLNEALQRMVDEEREKRRAARERLQHLVDEGALDFSKLDAADE
ncbi:type II toxin-antitoxin system VapB family antitoxin [Krasilnikovia sp. MM14-A1004]|uniref:type II toxin-antitoxin system VapB family antitoxin n=1 Tax=Krasilnikovia sp. MM14-A1004 TaxID=3373541 RepID=UPI00399CEEE9